MSLNAVRKMYELWAGSNLKCFKIIGIMAATRPESNMVSAIATNTVSPMIELCIINAAIHTDYY